jgi:hypothetical protein
MGLYDVLVYVHVLAFVFWLGGDLGVAILGSAFRNRAKPLATRLELLRLLGVVDMGPRTAWVIMVPLSITLVDVAGYWDVPDWGLWLAWLVGAIWMGLTWTIHLMTGKPIVPQLKQIEFWLKLAITAFYAGIGVTSLLGWGPLIESWLSQKALVFAAIFGAAIMIDVAGKPVGPLLLAVIEKGSSDETEIPLRRAMDRARLWVWLTYALLLVIGFLGTVKPT